MTEKDAYKAWGSCTDCGYEGMLEYSHVTGEDYGDAEALGVMMLLKCPACGTAEHALITVEYYREILEEAEDPGDE